MKQMFKLLRMMIFVSAFTLLFLGQPAPARADNIGLIFRGVAKTIGSAFAIPTSMLTAPGGFPFSLVTGAVTGTMKTVAGTISGAADIARGGAPYAKYAVFL